MSDRKSPAFSFYADSWIGGTLRMSFEEKGIYVELLADQWVNGGFSRDVALRVCRGVDEATLDRILRDKFSLCSDGLYRNARLEDERDKQAKNRERAQKNGKKGGRPRKVKEPTKNPVGYLGVSSGETKTITKTEPPKKLSDSDSDSVLVLDSDLDSDSGEREPAPSLGDGPIIPEKLRDAPGFAIAWQLWKGHVHERTFTRLGTYAEQVQLAGLAEKFDAAEAIRVIEFSISKQAKNLITDGSHQAASATGGKVDEVLI